MRSSRRVYTLAALNATGHITGMTGVGPFTAFTPGVTDGTAHQTTLTSTANLSAITMTIVGIDAQGNSVTESIAGPNINTINLVNYYKSITRITASATLGANTMNAGWTALAQTPLIPTDPYQKVGPLVTVGIAGTCTLTAQQTNSPVLDRTVTTAPTYITLGTASATATAQTLAATGTTGVRVTVASHTSGIITLDITQVRV